MHVCVCLHVSMLSFEGGVITKMKPLHLYFHIRRQHFVKAALKCSKHHRFYARQLNNIHIKCKSFVPLCNKTQTGITPVSPSTNSWHQSLIYSALGKTHRSNVNSSLSISICTDSEQTSCSNKLLRTKNGTITGANCWRLCKTSQIIWPALCKQIWDLAWASGRMFSWLAFKMIKTQHFLSPLSCDLQKSLKSLKLAWIYNVWQELRMSEAVTFLHFLLRRDCTSPFS